MLETFSRKTESSLNGSLINPIIFLAKSHNATNVLKETSETPLPNVPISQAPKTRIIALTLIEKIGSA